MSYDQSGDQQGQTPGNQPGMGQPGMGQATGPVTKKKSPLIWIIPLLLALVGGPLVCCGGCVLMGMGAIKAPVNAAVEAMNSNPEVAGKLGTPITAGSGLNVTDYQNSNNNGSAGVNFNATGPNGSAAVSGKMKLVAGTWSPDGLRITYDDGSEATIE